jgi:hypothetical protein
MRVLKKLYQGKYPLVGAFWGFYVGGIFASGFVGMLAAIPFILIHARPFGILIYGLVFFGYFSIVTIGVWRSANAYPYTRWWPILAKIAVGFMAVAMVLRLVLGAERFVGAIMM